MNTSFILRFQELCGDMKDSALVSGTQTITAVRAEAIDADPDSRRFGVLNQQNPSAGTKTKTGVDKEHGDEDRDFSRFDLIPSEIAPSMGTQTMTRTREEGADTDPSAQQLRAFSQCFLS